MDGAAPAGRDGHHCAPALVAGRSPFRDAAVRRWAGRQPYGPYLTYFPDAGVECFHGVIVQVALLKLTEWRRACIIESQNH